MSRSNVLGLAICCAAVLAGCHGSAGSLPALAPPATLQRLGESQNAVGPNLPERVARFGGVGSSNTIYADMPVSRPDTAPCTVELFQRAFKNFKNKYFPFKPPTQCPGPWAKVIFNFDIRVTKGVQYDRTAIVWVDGAVIFFGTTAEPSPTLAPHWHVERDVTDLSALFKQSSKGMVQLWNCYCTGSGYNGYQIGKAYLQFYPPDKKFPAPVVPDEVLGVPYSPPDGNVATLPKTPMEIQGSLPTNIVGAYLKLYLQSQSKEEQWFMCAPDHVWQKSHRELGFCRNSAFREGEVTVNGKPAGLSPIYPWIYTGGIDPYLWVPMPGVQTLEFVPFQVDLTPFAGELSDGQTQTIDVSVLRAFDYFSGAGDLELYLDPKSSKVSGRVTQDTLQTPKYDVIENVSFGTGAGLFGGPTAQGTVDTRSHTDYAIAGYVNTSSGKVTTALTGSSFFDNDQSYDYTPHKYVQLMTQNTHFATTTTTQNGKTKSTVTDSFEYPLTISYPLLPTSSGFKLPIKVYQGYSEDATGSQTENTVVTKDTMIFNPSFDWIDHAVGLLRKADRVGQQRHDLDRESRLHCQTARPPPTPPVIPRSVIMKAARLGTLLGCVALAAAMTACASPPGASTIPAVDADQRAAARVSWVKPDAAAQDLLYVSNGNGIVNVYGYFTHNLVGELIDFTQPEGECSDAKGDVYVTDYGAGDIDEYTHGGKTPLRVIDEKGYNPYACAIDLRSGDLAVANWGSGSYYSQGSLAIYAHAKGKPTYYSSKDLYHMNGVAYDRYGDLLVTGFYYYSSVYLETYFAYLPAKSKDFQEIALPPPNSSGWYMTSVLGVGWDGEYWTVDLYDVVYQYSIDIKPELVGSVKFDGAETPVAFYAPNPKKQATQAVSGEGFENDNDVYFFQYPAGGEPYASLTHGLDKPFGIAISLTK
jgi:hypothetical protein